MLDKSSMQKVCERLFEYLRLDRFFTSFRRFHSPSSSFSANKVIVKIRFDQIREKSPSHALLHRSEKYLSENIKLENIFMSHTEYEY